MSLLIAFNLYKSLFPTKASYNNIYEFTLRNHVLRLMFFSCSDPTRTCRLDMMYRDNHPESSWLVGESVRRTYQFGHQYRTKDIIVDI